MHGAVLGGVVLRGGVRPSRQRFTRAGAQPYMVVLLDVGGGPLNSQEAPLLELRRVWISERRMNEFGVEYKLSEATCSMH